MLQHMLVERFGLKFHKEQKEVRGYRLVVAKNGPKIKESAPEPPKNASTRDAQPAQTVSNGISSDGFPEVHAKWLSAPIQRLVAYPAFTLRLPVVDATGLNGTYNLSLSWILDPTLGDQWGPRISTALEDQLGLRLEAAKIMNTVVVVDHAERVPTANSAAARRSGRCRRSVRRRRRRVCWYPVSPPEMAPS